MDVREAIEKRRAYRSLEKTRIGEPVVRKLAEAAQLCCSAENHQPWRFVFVTDEKTLAALMPCLPSYNSWAANASMLVAVCSEEKLDDTVDDRDIVRDVAGARALKRDGNRRPYCLFDTGLATGFMILRATELGLVAHPIAGYLEQGVQEVLGIPREMTVIAMLVVGKRARKVDPELSDDFKADEARRPKRLSLEEFAFVNRYSARAASPQRRHILRRRRR